MARTSVAETQAGVCPARHTRPLSWVSVSLSTLDVPGESPMESRYGTTPARHARKARLAAALGLVLLGQAGCGREFFREWANQDVSEAVFEKSRDPRWRLDLFSVEPPAMARFAQPFDRDRPPAPPDDYATEALSPVPQWPDHRNLVPTEGAGYLTMLEQWKRDRPAEPSTASTAPIPVPIPRELPPAPPGGGSPFQRPNAPADGTPGRTPATGNPDLPPPPPIPNPNLSPSGLGANSRTNPSGMSPLPVSASKTASTSNPTNPTAAGASSRPAASPPTAMPRDSGVQRTGFQDPTQVPSTTPPTANPPRPGQAPVVSPDAPQGRPADNLPTPSTPLDPNPRDYNLAQPPTAPGSVPGQKVVGELEGLLIKEYVPLNEAEAAGLPRDTKPYVLTMEQAYTLGLINNRAYQSRLESVYLTALSVTLQRFNFEPQFIAGLSPITGPAGRSPLRNPANNFTYQTREVGSQISALNLGAVAGVGKLFSNGASILASFASQVTFNFVGRTPRQPLVQSFIPIQMVIPFLRGGGRAVTLEALTQAERTLLYELRNFAKFRQEYLGYITVGSQFTAAAINGGGGGNDPAVGFLPLLQDIIQVEIDQRNIAVYEKFVAVFQELVAGEGSGLTQLQVDQLDQQLQQARLSLVTDTLQYRQDLDSYKISMGLPPDVPLVPNRRLTMRFQQVYDKFDKWSLDKNRQLEQLPGFAAQLPGLEDVVIDGRSVIGPIREVDTTDPATRKPVNDDYLEDLLLAGERVALENRLDLMNARAQLYDTWRQIRFTANGLKGVFNVTASNQFITPPTTTNPFGFLDQAKNFQLNFNAELPLIRVVERNQFATALINYERQRRILQQAEDNIKFSIRNDIRGLQAQFRTYEINRRNFVLVVRQKDQTFEILVGPAASGGGGGGGQGAAQTQNLIQAQNNVARLQNTLVQTWVFYQQARFNLYRDLGILPFDEWEAFNELFPSDSYDASPGARDAGVGAAGSPEAVAPAQP